ncbi:vWA domain-containing protein [Lignipirellula cremea]|uniref:VWFA domain-containing protein n=1 Tax=Lignipirellula cremea TaxID=2528010 RepID=A0A518DX92_9BACT|nr:vWA domain-containing protein [Lignipirellula cremea]QDU96453.1 hypothetical protein Pla8534_42740 [Lignipirellula cremea]
MSDWALRLLGIDPAEIPAGSERGWRFLAAPESWRLFLFFFIVAAGAGVIYWLYRRENSTCSLTVRRWLAGLRIAVLLLLALVWLEPAITYVRLRERQASIVVLRDASQSMNVRDRYFEDQAAESIAQASGLSTAEIQDRRPSRADLLNDLAAPAYARFLETLQQRGDVIVADFSGQVDEREVRPRIVPSSSHPAGLAAAQTNLAGTGDADKKGNDRKADNSDQQPAPLTADGRSTELAIALQTALARDPLAAIVLFSDGQHTGVDDLGDVAQQARDRGVPVFVVGLGDAKPPRNLKVDKVYARSQAWLREPFEIEAVLSVQGVQADLAAGPSPKETRVQVELIERELPSQGSQPGPGQTVGRQEIALPPGEGRRSFKFTHTPQRTGSFVYTIRAESIPEERLEDDNQADSTRVTVEDERKIRVLLVSGSPSWDYRMVERLLLRENSIDLSCWLQTLDEDRPQAGNTQIDELPRDKASLLAFDVVLLFDPNPDEFDKEWIDLLKNEFCGRHSGGLLYMAGPQYSNQFLQGNRTGGLADLLPVRLAEIRGGELLDMMAAHPQSWPLRAPPAYIDHPVMSISGDERASLAQWGKMPGVYWTYPAQEARPTAQVLLEHSDPSLWRGRTARPLMAAGRYGSANTMYLGFPGTWRWRSAGAGAEYFDTFWVRAVRFLYDSRKHDGKRRGFVQAEKDRYEIGENVRLFAQLQDDQFNDLLLDEASATVTTDGSRLERFTLRPIPDQPGRYQAMIPAMQTGVHTVRIELPDDLAGEDSEGVEEAAGPASEQVETTFTVELPGLETNAVWLNRPLLEEIADVSGGAYYQLDQLQELAAEIPDATEKIAVPGKPLGLWNNWLTLALAAVLLTAEWGVRKWNKLL